LVLIIQAVTDKPALSSQTCTNSLPGKNPEKNQGKKSERESSCISM